MNDKRPLIIFGIAFVLILVAFFLMKGAAPKFDWSEHYREGSKDPYGTYVVYNLLENYFPAHDLKDIKKSVFDDLPSGDSISNANYVFVGEGLYMDTADVNQLLSFVEMGNTAFISSKTVPYDLMFYVYYEECNDYFWDDYTFYQDTIGSFTLLHNKLKTEQPLDFKYIKKDKAGEYNWHFIDTVFFCDQEYGFIKLGTFNDGYVNFAKIKYGNGYFYFHTNPIAFSNIQLLDQVGLNYANKVFAHLDEGPLFWDSYSRVQESVSRRRNQIQNYSAERELATEGPLSYILGEQALKWAWYLLLATAFLYLLFRAKRNQRIIPVYEGNKNTSLEFISTIGSLYFLQNDHKKLCVQKMKLFLNYVRERYSIPTKEINAVFVNKLHAKSEVSTEHLNKIFEFYKNIKESNFISDNTLGDFHAALDTFYQTRK